MKDEKSAIQSMHESAGQEKIKKIEDKIDVTEYNIEVSKELIANTATDAQREKLIEKNTQRRHAVGSMKKEIRDIEQTLEKRSTEIS